MLYNLKQSLHSFLILKKLKKYSSAGFFINVLLNEPQKSGYFRDKNLKGLRNNYIFIVDITQNTLQDINDDDNGAYKQINTSAMFYWKGDKVHKVYRNSEELHNNRKISFNNYEEVFVPDKEVVTLHRRYCKEKCFPLKRMVMARTPIDGPIILYAAVLNQTDSPHDRGHTCVMPWKQ